MSSFARLLWMTEAPVMDAIPVFSLSAEVLTKLPSGLASRVSVRRFVTQQKTRFCSAKPDGCLCDAQTEDLLHPHVCLQGPARSGAERGKPRQRADEVQSPRSAAVGARVQPQGSGPREYGERRLIFSYGSYQ